MEGGSGANKVGGKEIFLWLYCRAGIIFIKAGEQRTTLRGGGGWL